MIKAEIKESCLHIFQLVKKGHFKFDNPVQRGFVWDNKQKSGLIESIISSYYIPPVVAHRHDNIYDLIDGKQRISTIFSFINNEFKLSSISVNYDGDEGVKSETIKGKTYSELSDEIKNIINSYIITIVYYDDMTVEQERILYKKLNNGKPLAPKDKNIMNCPDINIINSIGEHEFFTYMFNSNSLQKRKQLAVVMKMWAMLYAENPSFNGQRFNHIIKNMKIDSAQVNELKQILDTSLEIYESLSRSSQLATAKFITETHFISLIPLILEEIKKNSKLDNIVDFIMYFYDVNATSISKEYNASCVSSPSKLPNVITRDKELRKYFEEFKKDKNN